MNDRRAFAVAALLWICTLIRVASTHRVFSPTFDEPIHVAAGHQYLHDHEYTLDFEHPPLARALLAFPFRHAAVRSDDAVEWGNQLYASTGDYLRGVAASRRGNLVFLLIALAALTFWARDLFGTMTGVIACAMFAMLPPVLAHAGLATTDMAGTAGFCAGLFALYRWLERTTWIRTVAFGLVVGLGLVTKFSFPIFFGSSLVVVLIAKRRAPIAKGIVALLIALVVVWTTYRFDLVPLEERDVRAVTYATELFGSPWLATKNDIPAPAFVIGLMDVAVHGRRGHPAYFLGRVSEQGWWYYFPVVFAIKTPIALLLFAGAGTWALMVRKQHRELIFLPLLVLAIGISSHLNLGVRHILPLYAPLSVLAAVGLMSLWRSRAKWFAAAAAGWLVIGSLAAHPDYLPWANAFAGKHPERIVVDSNFDWGQDVARLRTVCRREHVTELGTFLFGTTDQQRIGLPPAHGIEPFTHSAGWIAVSESAIIPAEARDPLAYYWLAHEYRFQRVGKTIRLYHVD